MLKAGFRKCYRRPQNRLPLGCELRELLVAASAGCFWWGLQHPKCDQACENVWKQISEWQTRRTFDNRIQRTLSASKTQSQSNFTTASQSVHLCIKPQLGPMTKVKSIIYVDCFVKIQFVLRNKHFHLSYKIQSVNLYRKIIAVFFSWDPCRIHTYIHFRR